MSRLPPVLAFLALAFLALAGPALADGVPGPARRGFEGAYRGRVHHARAPRPHPFVRARFVQSRGPVAFAAPVGPASYAWPEPAEVRVPIYNRPSHLPLSW